ncbi:phage tail tape measure protein [Larkinella sp.]|uniref:phage tail tape measure protein n=1 Tax=Larkinella sp. TaxID=2034517 RepID=UPI003BACDD55
MNQTEESRIKLIIDGEDAERSLAGLRQEAREITAEMRRMKEAGEENTDAYRQLAEQKKQLNAVTREYLQNLDLENASINELRARKRLLNNELKDLKVNSDDWLDKMKEVADVDQRLDAVNAEMRALREHTDDNVSVWSRLKDTFLGTFAAFALDDIIQEVVQFGRESIQAAAETSDAFADIAKSTQMTTDEVAALDAQIRQIDTRTAQAELLEIAKVGGQINIAKDEMLGFVRATDQAVVALGDEFSGGVEEVTSKLGTMKNLFQETRELDAGTAISKIGSALNELGAAGTATAPVVADFTTRMGQLGDLSPQISQTLGLGAAFQELGLSAEISAGGLSNILLTAAKDTATFARQLGITEGEMKKLINTNPNEFLLKLAESLRGLPADQVAKQLSDMGIKSQEATKVMSLLKDQTQLVRDKQVLANTAMKDGTSLTKEFEIKNQTAAAQLAKFGKEVQSASVDLGNKLLPVVLKGGEYALTFGKAIGALPAFLNENKVSIGLLAAALITFNAQAILAEANSLRLAAAEKIRTIATEAAAIAQRLLNVAMSANPIGAVIAILLTLGAALVAAYQHSETFRAGVNGLWQAMKTAADVAIQFVKAFVTMDIKGMADAMLNGGKRVADAFSTTYQATLQAAHAKTEADHQTHVDKKTTASKTGAQAAATAGIQINAQALTAMGGDNDQHREAEKKKAQEHDRQVAEEKKRANRQANDDIRQMQIALIADEQQREIANLTYKRDQQKRAVQESVADAQLKAQQIDLIEKEFQANVAQTQQQFREKKEKAEQEKRDKKLQSEKEQAEKEKSLFKELADYQEQTTQSLYENQLFAARNNEQQTFALKKQRLAAELAEERQKIQTEYAEKKAHIERVLTDEKQKAQAIDTLNAWKNAQLGAADRKHEQESTALHQEHHEKRKQTVQEFFSAVEGLMNGDFSSFMNFLMNKLTNAKKAQADEHQDWKEKSQEKLEIAGLVIQGLTALNKQYLDNQLKKIEKEKESQLKSWKEQYDQGKISKDQYEKTIAKINADAAEKEKNEKVKAWKRDQAMQIAMALINAAMAALKSLATMGFPLGLIGVAASAAMAAIQIGIIKSQKPPSYAHGGYLRNGGVPNGPGHGSAYGQSGIALVRRDSGQEVGEMEGGEPIMILSRNTYRNNRPIIDKLLNSSLHRNGAPIMARSGALYTDGGDYRSYLEPLQGGRMYLFGSGKAKKAAEQAKLEAKIAERDAQKQQEEALADAQQYSAGAGDYGGGGDMEGVDGDAAGAVSMTNAEISKSQQMMTAIAQNTEDTVEMLSSANATLVGLANQLSTANGYLDRIAAKELSVSVHNVVNVMNAINVVNNDSNLK